MDTLPIQSEQPQQRFILARLDQLTFLFPSTVVAEVLIAERSQILALPFYDPAVLGIIHNGGQIVPLISMRQIVGIPAALAGESLTVVRLGNAAGDLVGLGLVVDTTLGIRSSDQLPPDLFSADRLPDSTNSDSKMRLFQPEILGGHLWQPQRWLKSTIPSREPLLSKTVLERFPLIRLLSDLVFVIHTSSSIPPNRLDCSKVFLPLVSFLLHFSLFSIPQRHLGYFWSGVYS